MKNTKTYFGLAFLTIADTILVAAAHMDAPSSQGTSADITDFYAFEPTTGSDNTVFMVDLQSSVLPDLAYGAFDENVLTEINIDLDGAWLKIKVFKQFPEMVSCISLDL
jgi:hypothetical protein